MKPKTKKILKWIGGIIGVILLIVLGLGYYIWSYIPRPQGEPPVLQTELFTKPAKEYTVEGKFIFKSASELAELIRTKQATSVEITKEFINYIKNNKMRAK